jgi:hypothetical protein
MIMNLRCPNCKELRLNKTGFQWSGHNQRQRYICRNCHLITIKPESIDGEVVRDVCAVEWIDKK